MNNNLNNNKQLNTPKKAFKQVINSLNKKERFFVSILIGIFTISLLAVLWHINKYFIVEIPMDGGSITEGVVGTPRFVNPLLAISDADRDLEMLVYSGLMRKSPDGDLINDLAENVEVSKDGLVYKFTLKDNIYFHDGSKITSDDVLFTIAKAQDDILKSPKRASWDGVVAEKIDDRNLQFKLNSPYSLFLENTTLGILPKHIWGKISSEQFGFSQFNTKPIGSGPYRVKNIKKNSSGIPVYYELTPFKKWSIKKPYIKKITMSFYPNEKSLIKAFMRGDIESINAVSPKSAKELDDKGYSVITTPLPRIFGVFFNQSQAPLFTDKSVRKALDIALDKSKIIEDVLYGYGMEINMPIPPGSIGYTPTDKEKGATATSTSPIEKARAILTKNNWIPNEKDGIMEKKIKKETTRLEFSLSTSNVPELKETAQIVKKTWEQMGAKVELKIFDAGDLNQNIIRPRKYDALLFGEIIGHDPDLFAFWHSSQRNDPGLNIALYANIDVDKFLDDARKTRDAQTKIEDYKKFQNEISKDIPAVFIYTPDFIYIVPKKIKGVRINSITTSSERFLDIHNWFIDTDKVWKFFIKK